MADQTELVTPGAVNAMVAEAFPGSRSRCAELTSTHAIAVLDADDTDIRPGGYVSGPTQFGVADAALWYLAFGVLGRIEPMAVTSELSIRYVRPAFGNRLVARAELASVSRRNLVGTVIVWTTDPARPTAVAQGTYALPDPTAR